MWSETQFKQEFRNNEELWIIFLKILNNKGVCLFFVFFRIQKRNSLENKATSDFEIGIIGASTKNFE